MHVNYYHVFANCIVVVLYEKDFFEACKNKDNFAVQSCILDGCDPIIMQNEFGQFALHVASLQGNMQAVQLLVEIYHNIHFHLHLLLCFFV